MLAGVFALVSVQNIAHFFIELEHPTVASWTLGLAIGTALVVLAHLLSEINMRETKAFVGLLAVTLILVALSGIIQGNEYSHKLGLMGYVLAFTLAATGEIVLPLAHSWHRDAQRRQAVHDAGERAEALAAQTLINVMAGVDVARAQAKAEKRIEQLVVAHLDHIVGKLMPASAQARSPLALPDMAVSAPNAPSNGFGPHNLPAANQARAESLSERQTQLLDLLRAYEGRPVDTLNRADLGRQLDVSGKTIGRDLHTLEQHGAISMNGVVQIHDKAEPVTPTDSTN